MDEIERQKQNKVNVITTIDDLMSDDREDDFNSPEDLINGKPAINAVNRVN